VEHVRQLFFHGVQHRSIPCYRRLAYLVKQGYLRSMVLPAFHKHFLLPGVRARRILSYVLKGSAIKRIRIESPLLMLHKLAVCDIRVALAAASKASSMLLVTNWINESQLRQAPLVVDDGDEQTKLIPDASFTVYSQATGTSVVFYLELDRATVSLRAIWHRVRSYLLRKHHLSPVLFVVPHATRQTAIAQIVREEAGALNANPTTIWITQKSQLTPATALAAPWVVVGHERSVTFHGLAAAPQGTDVVGAGTGGHW